MQTNQLHGCVVVGMSVGDLMGYSDALEELMPPELMPDVEKLQQKHTPV